MKTKQELVTAAVIFMMGKKSFYLLIFSEQSAHFLSKRI